MKREHMKREVKENDLFRSFWQAGYECADHLNCHGDRVNLLKETFHDVLVEEDYTRLISLNLLTVREGICWNTVDKGLGKYDWTEVSNRIRAGQKYSIQQIWDICHFGSPDDLSPLQPRFIERFTEVCRSFTKLWKSLSNETLIVTPINEISFLSWLGGERKQTVPYTHGLEFEVKCELVKASISAMKAILEIEPNARFMHTEPLVWVFPGNNNPETIQEVEQINNIKLEVFDMLAGKKNPEFGGEAKLLDIIGLDFYHDNQWIHWGERLHWAAPRHPRWKPLSELLQHVYQKFKRPIVLSETSHIGIGRGEWILEIGQECKKALEEGVELLGVCLYPIIDRPDWDNLNHYHNSGLWDLEVSNGGPSSRIICDHYAKDLLKAQDLIKPYISDGIKSSAA